MGHNLMIWLAVFSVILAGVFLYEGQWAKCSYWIGAFIGYSAFLDKKSQLDTRSGFEPLWMPSFLFDFQQSLVEWAIRKGKAAIFADCGLGKTPMQLVWAENVIRHTNKPVLILTPLAVGAQTYQEAAKFGIHAERSHDGHARNGITITNYEQLHKFNPSDFSGLVCDESSILKNYDGATRSASGGHELPTSVIMRALQSTGILSQWDSKQTVLRKVTP